MLNLIPTTEAAVLIQRIIEEEPGIRSVICLNGTTQEVPVSPRYHAFVKRPTGVIEKHFGHGAFRLDVSASVDDGDSWQLPVFIAHWLQGLGKFEHSEEGRAGLIWSTGEVNNDLIVGSVQHIAEKVQASLQLIHQTLEAEQPVLMLVAPSNLPQLRQVLQTQGLIDNPGVQIAGLQQALPENLADLICFTQDAGKPAVTDYPVSKKERSEDIDGEVNGDNCGSEHSAEEAKSVTVDSKRQIPFQWSVVPRTVLLFLAAVGATIAWGYWEHQRSNELLDFWKQGELYELEQRLEHSTAAVTKALFDHQMSNQIIKPQEVKVTLIKHLPTDGRSCLSYTQAARTYTNSTAPLTKKEIILWQGAGDSVDYKSLRYGLKHLCKITYQVKNNSERPLAIRFGLQSMGGKVLANPEGNGVQQRYKWLKPGEQLQISPRVKFYENSRAYQHLWQLEAAPFPFDQIDKASLKLADPRWGGVFVQGNHRFIASEQVYGDRQDFKNDYLKQDKQNPVEQIAISEDTNTAVYQSVTSSAVGLPENAKKPRFD